MADVAILGKNGANINLLQQLDKWAPLPAPPSSTSTYYAQAASLEPPEQHQIPNTTPSIFIAYAFMHTPAGSERSVAWITGDVARFQGNTVRLLLAVYDKNAEALSRVLLAAVGDLQSTKKRKNIYKNDKGVFVLAALEDFASNAEHAADVVISDEVLHDLRLQGITSCAAGLPQLVVQQLQNKRGRNVRAFELSRV